ncbi:MAG TPA: sigma-70 family RNA polymerase sigma factor [Longimicrobiaceae bacterium]|nr:sigma-70 family RNA polymerase sigma factor [Longimicrobiaceae bacterium]
MTVLDPPEPAAMDPSAARREGPAAFEEVYRAHYRRVYALLLRMTCDPLRAEELTQDTFVRVWQTLGSFRGESSLGTWIHTVAVRTALQQMRADTRREARVTATDDLARYAAEAKRAMPDTRIDLERAIAALPAGARTVLLLVDVEGYAYEEVARLLGVTIGTVKSQLHRARRLAMEALER